MDSGGGDAEAGLAIGEFIAKANVDIEVQGICVSSCANYIFTAGRNKILNKGIVGYHGNITALFNSITTEDFVAQMKASGLSEQQAKDLYSHFVTEVVPRKKKFFQV